MTKRETKTLRTIAVWAALIAFGFAAGFVQIIPNLAGALLFFGILFGLTALALQLRVEVLLARSIAAHPAGKGR